LANLDQPGYRKLIGLADVIVDGPYRTDARHPNVPFRGSSNQRLILAKETLETGKIVEWQPQRVAI
ncbi:MAG TPA: 4Fe-4S cluster-binding domain-containing protein, partial [Bacillota bacterium]|nr:4Fe-4S cluster-binding domain-containing protein [Bacillota bacterium]